LSSAYFGQKLHADAKSASVRAASAQKDAGAAKESLLALQEVLTPDVAPQPLDRVTSQALLSLYNLRTAHGVTLNQLTPGKLGASIDTPVSELAEDVPGSTLKSVKVNLTGSYTSYFGLLNYLQAMQEGTVALTRLKVVDSTFEESLRIYGTSPSN
jgi:hypothetical protein